MQAWRGPVLQAEAEAEAPAQAERAGQQEWEWEWQSERGVVRALGDHGIVAVAEAIWQWMDDACAAARFAESGERLA